MAETIADYLVSVFPDWALYSRAIIFNNSSEKVVEEGISLYEKILGWFTGVVR